MSIPRWNSRWNDFDEELFKISMFVWLYVKVCIEWMYVHSMELANTWWCWNQSLTSLWKRLLANITYLVESCHCLPGCNHIRYTVKPELEAAASIFFNCFLVRLEFKGGYLIRAASKSPFHVKLSKKHPFHVKLSWKTSISRKIEQMRLLFKGGFYYKLWCIRCGFYSRAATIKGRLLIPVLR